MWQVSIRNLVFDSNDPFENCSSDDDVGKEEVKENASG